MSKSAAFLLAVALGAGACSTTEPPQTIVAVVPAAELDASVAPAVQDDADTTDTTEQAEAEAQEAPETSVTSEVPASTEPTEAPTTVPAEPITVPAEVPVAPPSAPGTISVEELLSTAIASDAQSISARFTGGISMVGDVEGETVDMTMAISGAFDADNNAMEMSIDMSSMANMFGADVANDPDLEMFSEIFAEPMQMKSIGDTAWIKWGLLDMFTGAEGKWLEMESADSEMTTTGGSPTDILGMLGGANGTATTVGTESIGGVDTTHYALSINVADLAGSLDAAEAAELEAISDEFGDLPLDLWIDSDGLIRRLEMNMAPDAFSEIMGSGDSFSAKVWYEISDYGSDVVITAPAADDVIDGESLGLF